MVKPIGPSCNLKCAYCYYLDTAEMYPETDDFRMDRDTLERFIEQYLEAHPGPVVPFAWQGGEPTLMGMDFFEDVLEIQQDYLPDGKRVQNSIQTNGTKLSADWGRFLADHDFLVGISIDGPEALHDVYRRTRDGQGTFTAVMEGLSHLQDHEVAHNVLCVLNDVNSHHPIEIYEFFRSQGIDWLQFIPLVEAPGATHPNGIPRNGDARPGRDTHDAEGYPIPDWVRERGGVVEEADPDYDQILGASRRASVSNRSVDPEVYGEFLCEVFDRWIRNDVGHVSVRIFDQCLERLLHDRSSLCIFAERCGRQLAMEHNGDLYACDHFVDPGFKRGNIHDRHIGTLATDRAQERFGTYKDTGRPDRCKQCNVSRFCHGGCPKHRHLTTPNGDPGLNYLCAGYRRFFTYVQQYLDLFEETIADGLPPAYVMDAVDTHDANDR